MKVLIRCVCGWTLLWGKLLYARRSVDTTSPFIHQEDQLNEAACPNGPMNCVAHLLTPLCTKQPVLLTAELVSVNHLYLVIPMRSIGGVCTAQKGFTVGESNDICSSVDSWLTTSSARSSCDRDVSQYLWLLATSDRQPWKSGVSASGGLGVGGGVSVMQGHLVALNRVM